MKITKKEQKQLINRINDIMFELNIILSDCDSSTTAKAVGHVVDSVGLILNHINNAEVDTTIDDNQRKVLEMYLDENKISK